jgi:acyl-coenzyme A synthetase/AMP-(fatty) acid ligase
MKYMLISLAAAFLRPSSRLIVERLQDYVKQTLQPHKYPRIIEFVRDIPKTGTGKIDRQALSRATGHEGDQP